MPDPTGVRSALEKHDWDLCQSGLELGAMYGRDQLEYDAIWNQVQQLPLEWMSDFGYTPRRDKRETVVYWILKRVRKVRNASESEVISMLPDDHPKCSL